MAGETEFRVLGPLEVRSGGVALPVSRGKQRAVLAVLLLNAGRVVSLAELAETLWGADPPLSARAAVQNYVMRLRKALRDADGSRISTLPNGYMIAVDAGELDVIRFEERLSAARAAARGGSWDAADARARAALSLWRGAPLEDVESELLAVREVPRLTEMRLQALEVRIDAELHCGRQGEVIGELRQLAVSHPLREHLHALLMLALYRDGRQAEALAAYQHARQVLIDELGTEPGPELRQLHQQILTADPGALTRVDPGLHDAPTPLVRFSLPPDTAAFTGRDPELSAITGGAVVTVGAISGMPGAGKTALAVHVAHVLAGQFPDGQLFIDLQAHTPGHEPVKAVDALAGLLAAIGADVRYLPGDLNERAAMWRDRMAGQRVLLVLDNAASSSQVAPLLPGAGGCLVLVTSRRHLGDLPGAVTPVLVDVLPPEQAADMFTRLAPRAEGDRDGVAELAGLAGFLPLAISLLARVLVRHPSWTLGDLIAETRARLLTLTAEHSSVAAAFEVSYRHLDPVLQRFFRLLGVHPGTVIDAYSAAALADMSAAEAAGYLEVLYGEGLVTESGYRRYGMHDLIRRYARDLAAASDPATGQQALDRLLDYYQFAAARAEKFLARQARPGSAPATPAGFEVPVLDDAGRALAWARAELASLLACLDLATRTGQHARVVAMTAGAAAVLRRYGPWAEAVTRHASATGAARHLGDRLGEANALADLGDVRWLTGDYPGAARALKEALGIYRDLGDRRGEANALDSLGIVWLMTDDYQSAAGALEEALGIYRDLGDRRGEANALNDLGNVRQVTGDYLGAAEALEDALGIYRDLGSRRGEAHVLTDLGAVRRLTHDYPVAALAVGQALRIYRDLGDRQGEAEALNEQGTLHRARCDRAQAEESHLMALELAGAIGSSRDEACALAGLGRCAIAAGLPAQAAVWLRQAQQIFQRIGAAETRDVLAELTALTRPEPTR